MLKNVEISSSQFTIMIILYSLGGAILTIPTGIVSLSKENAWIAGIIGAGFGLLFVWLYNTLGSRFPNMTLVEYSEVILGKWMGKIASLLYITYILYLCATTLRAMGDFMVSQIMPETPLESVYVLTLGVVIMGVRLGIEPFSRAAEILIPWVLLLILITMVSISPQIRLENIQPVLEDGIKPVLRSAFFVLGFPFLQLEIMLMIFPYVNRVNAAKKSLIVGSIIGSMILVSLTILCILVLGVDTTIRHLYPVYALAKKINVGNFLQRIEAVIAAVWIISIVFKLIILFYSLSLGLSQTFNLKDYRFMVFPLGIIVLVMANVIYPNSAYHQTFTSKILVPYSLTYGLLLPLFLLGVAKLRRKK